MAGPVSLTRQTSRSRRPPSAIRYTLATQREELIADSWLNRLPTRFIPPSSAASLLRSTSRTPEYRKFPIHDYHAELRSHAPIERREGSRLSSFSQVPLPAHRGWPELQAAVSCVSKTWSWSTGFEKLPCASSGLSGGGTTSGHQSPGAQIDARSSTRSAVTNLM